MFPHEDVQQRPMTQLLMYEQFNNSGQMCNSLCLGKALGCSQKFRPSRLFAELNGREGIRYEPQFVGLQTIGSIRRHIAGTQGVIFEVIRPDLEISRTHRVTLMIAQRRVCEVIREFL
jgi:hypothetical protein